MPQNSKFYGNVAGVPVGSPDDDIFNSEFFPDGQSALGYMRKGLPSEMALDRITSPKLADRENGYMPDPPPEPMSMEMPMRPDPPTKAEMRQMEIARERRARIFLEDKENENRRVRRSMRITTGNTTGSFTGPPDRVR